MELLLESFNEKQNKNILIIDNLSFLNTCEDCFNEIFNSVKDNSYIKIFVISKKIHKAKNIILNPDKIKDTKDFFKQNIFFDAIIDINNSDYIQQLSIFSLFFEKTTKYLVKINNEYKKETIYNFQKFNQNIIVKNNYLFITK